MSDQRADEMTRCTATYTAYGETVRCESEAGHDGKHVSLFRSDPDDPMDAIWKDSDRGAGHVE